MKNSDKDLHSLPHYSAQPIKLDPDRIIDFKCNSGNVLLWLWHDEFTTNFCTHINDTGTAGVWRISALYESGGWNHRTTVEDMDLAVRASLRGWKFLYLPNLKVPFT